MSDKFQDPATLPPIFEQEYPGQPTEQPPVPEFLTPEEVEHYLHHKFLLESEISQLRQQMEAKVKQKNSALVGLNDKYEKRLEATIREQHKLTGSKTFHFDYATCRIKKGGGGIKIVDEQAAIEWASNMPSPDQFLVTALRKDEYKKMCLEYLRDSGGELLPGVDIEEEKLNFTIGKAPKAAPIEMEEEE